jgi:hypothetical protein
MPRLIDPGAPTPIVLEQLTDYLDSPAFDPRDEESFAAAGPWLARLGANRDFLADLAVAELKARFRRQAAQNRYSAQVIMIHAPGTKYFIRANFWPAAQDAVLRASGTAPFFYGVAHDHNFSFLTVGYKGPGYWSDYYEHDYEAAVGIPGEPVELRFVERSRLEEGKVMLYRAHRDVHRQLPADSLSISLNIMEASPRFTWLDQYRFDVEAGRIDGILTTSASEALLALAAHFGGGGLAEDYALRHPSGRMRLAAWRALASAAETPDARAAVFERGVRRGDAFVAGHCRAFLDRIAS